MYDFDVAFAGFLLAKVRLCVQSVVGEATLMVRAAVAGEADEFIWTILHLLIPICIRDLFS